jgi:hypothetical protein
MQPQQSDAELQLARSCMRQRLPRNETDQEVAIMNHEDTVEMRLEDFERLTKWLDRQLTLSIKEATKLLQTAVASESIRKLNPLLQPRAQAAYVEGPAGWRRRGLHIKP